MSKHNELRAQHGEPAFKPYFLRYLATKGVDESAWAQAWNSWHTRMDADKSGQLWARFNTAQTALTMQAHFGDVADMSQEVRGGLTLDMFARLSAEASQPGVDFDGLLARHGVSAAVWNSGRDAWNQAMSQDTMHKITTQYGQLYAKYNPAHVAAMQAQAAQMIANRAAVSAQEEEPEVEYTVEAALAELQSPVPRTRWHAAHLLAQKIQTELEGDRARQRQALAACVPQLLEALDRHDKETVSLGRGRGARPGRAGADRRRGEGGGDPLPAPRPRAPGDGAGRVRADPEQERAGADLPAVGDPGLHLAGRDARGDPRRLERRRRGRRRGERTVGRGRPDGGRRGARGEGGGRPELVGQDHVAVPLSRAGPTR
ncbi:hypothetical protein [Nannocystis pusilla]|uniref:hypothetical protein n=1 Tax=Nannocystis pusilla TaxID=889268 RepID=UPI003DA5F277